MAMQSNLLAGSKLSIGCSQTRPDTIRPVDSSRRPRLRFASQVVQSLASTGGIGLRYRDRNFWLPLGRYRRSRFAAMHHRDDVVQFGFGF